jgi:hypothetical protein
MMEINYTSRGWLCGFAGAVFLYLARYGGINAKLHFAGWINRAIPGYTDS